MPELPQLQLRLEGLRSVRGQSRAVELLGRAVATGRVASTYLFEGPDGVGKERTARALAQVMVCADRRPDGDACGACSPCRQVVTRTHVDILTLAREIDVLSQGEHRKSDIKSEIVVEKIRQLQTERLAYQPHQGSRWVIVRDAHEMNTAAANALLKTLEEPPARTHFALVTAHPNRLLQTVRSRCQRVRFAPLEPNVIHEILLAQGISEGPARDAAALASGSVTNALDFADQETLASRRDWVERVIAALRAGRPGGYVDTAEALKDLAKSDEQESLVVLALIERHFHDEAMNSIAEQPRRAVACAARADLVRQTVDSLDRNVNLQMALESMLVQLREVRA